MTYPYLLVRSFSVFPGSQYVHRIEYFNPTNGEGTLSNWTIYIAAFGSDPGANPVRIIVDYYLLS
jgi:hypothetical protein